MTGTWAGVPASGSAPATTHRCHDSGRGGDPNGPWVLQACRNAPIGWKAMSLVVGFRETGKRGAILVSLPPVAVVTASVARDIQYV